MKKSSTTTPLSLFAAALLCSAFQQLSLLPVAQATTTSTTTSSFTLRLCLNETQACQDDATCEWCLGTWITFSSSEDCANTWTTTSSSSTSTTCDVSGAKFCCGFDDGTAEACMENALMVEYWECIMEVPSEDGCTVNDMPCYTALLPAESANAAARDGRKGGVALLAAGSVISAAVATAVAM